MSGDNNIPHWSPYNGNYVCSWILVNGEWVEDTWEGLYGKGAEDRRNKQIIARQETTNAIQSYLTNLESDSPEPAPIIDRRFVVDVVEACAASLRCPQRATNVHQAHDAIEISMNVGANDAYRIAGAASLALGLDVAFFDTGDEIIFRVE